VELAEQTIHCPYCNESIQLLIDESAGEQDYVEDCQVCCRPIEISIAAGTDGSLLVDAHTDAE